MADKAFNLFDEIDEPDDLEKALDTSRFYPHHNEEPTEEEVPSLKYETPAEKEIKSKKAPWTPSADILADLPESKAQPVIYDKDEIIVERGAPINGGDEANIKQGNAVIGALQRQYNNIEEAKARHHIKYLRIPHGELETKFHIAAENTDYDAAQAALDELLDIVENEAPYMILARTDDYVAPETDIPVSSTDDTPVMSEEEMKNDDICTVIINKKDAAQIAWTEEEAAKIKRSRTIELKIVESKDLQIGNIEDVEDDAIDSILSTYERSVAEVSAALPASHYRATFTGLTYAEVIDLSTATDLDNYDGERKKWSIAFNHIKNQTIGPWEEYKLYRDPVTKKMVKAKTLSTIPPEVSSADIHEVSKFEDFMRKTSYMDLEFIIWKILCATTMGTEIVNIKCNVCNHSYDYVYRPEEMLRVERMDPAVLDDIKAVATADSRQEIMALYESGPVCNSNYIDLPNSKYKVIYGHVSAYEYLEHIYSKVKDLEAEMEDMQDGMVLSKMFSYTMLPMIKSFLLPSGNGWKRISGADNIIKVIDTLDEVDYRAIMEISRLAKEPYTLEFSIKDAMCPQCKSKSDIEINNMTTLLFIVARSLASVSVSLSST